MPNLTAKVALDAIRGEKTVAWALPTKVRSRASKCIAVLQSLVEANYCGYCISLETLTAAEVGLEPSVCLVHVSDREGDIYDLFVQTWRPNRPLL